MLLSMALNFPPAITSLIRMTQMMAERLAEGLAARLGIGRFGHLVFLPRATHQQITAEIRYIECLVRRSLFLAAAALGALPPASPRLRASPAGARPQSGAASGGASGAASGAPRPPRFCLVETARPGARRPVAARHPAQAEWAPGPHQAGAGVRPAGGLVRRYLAIEGVFNNPWPTIARMRRLIAVRPRRIVPRLAGAVVSSAHINAVNRRILRALQAEVDAAAPLLDTG